MEVIHDARREKNVCFECLQMQPTSLVQFKVCPLLDNEPKTSDTAVRVLVESVG